MAREGLRALPRAGADAMKVLGSADEHAPARDGWCRLRGFFEGIAAEQFDLIRGCDHDDRPHLVHAEEASRSAYGRAEELAGDALRPEDFARRELRALNH